MTRTRTLVALITVLAATSANAAEFSGKCTDYRKDGKAACEATQWCHWVEPKQVKVVVAPNGKEVRPGAFCAFRPGFKAAYASK